MAKTVAKKNLPWFEVLLGSRVVDCIRAADLVEAMTLASITWDRTASMTANHDTGEGHALTVLPLRERPVKAVITPSLAEIRKFGDGDFKAGALNYWPFSGPMIAHSEK